MNAEFQYCITGKRGSYKRLVEKMLLALAATVLYIATMFVMADDLRELGTMGRYSKILLLISVIVFAGSMLYRRFSDPFHYRKYRVQENGILTRNGKPQDLLFHWDRIKEIRIMPFGRKREAVCVCFLETPEKDIADQLVKHPAYAYRRMDKMLVMTMDDALLRSIKQYYHEPIHNDLPTYKEDWEIQ